MVSKSVPVEHSGAPRTEHCRKGALALNASLSREQRRQNARHAALVLHSVNDGNGKSLHSVKVTHRRWHRQRVSPNCSLCTSRN
jgi:hypothetical protein